MHDLEAGDELTATERAALAELEEALRFQLAGPKSVHEIAERLGLSVAYVRHIMRQGMTKLRALGAKRRDWAPLD